MSYDAPTLQELFNSHLARLESALGQDAPENEKAFLVVLAAAEAGLDIGLYKYAADRAIQNLALTATGPGLDKIGLDNNTPRQNAQTCILIADLPATNGTVIDVNTEFVGDANGLRYKTEAAATAAASVAEISLRCVDVGALSNLDVGDTLSISTQIAGAETVATITEVSQIGTDAETDANYRPRVLLAQRAQTGGGNAADYKIWSEAVEGVRRVFPYSKRPAGEGTTYPGDRTIYVECTTDIEADGIAPQSLLDDVRTAINTDPDTGKARPPLGLPDDTLFVEPITRTTFYVIIEEFDVDAENGTDCKSDLDDALETYFLAVKPFVDSVDFAADKNNIITEVTVSEIVQDVLNAYGASATSVSFCLSQWVAETDPYELDDDELAKFGAIQYA